MPPFDLLADRTVVALIAYLKTFSPKWTERAPAAPIPWVGDPFRASADRSEAIRRGEAIYHGFATCWSCHPAYVSESRIQEYAKALGASSPLALRQNLDVAIGKADTQGALVYPPDFLRDYVRAGTDVDDLYRAIGAGITGTAMPTWIDAMHRPGATEGDPPLVEPADVWAVAYYVRDMIEKSPALLPAGVAVRPRPQAIHLQGAPPTTSAAPPAPAPTELFEEE
jgi:hypothetical protein